jgi:sporulation protein YlmC with PRC-barrel domain
MLTSKVLMAGAAMAIVATMGHAQQAPATSTTTMPAETQTKITPPAFVANEKGQLLASNLIGQSIYDKVGPGASSIGNVNDIVVTPDGKVNAVVIGVGGFLGIGEKEVALPVSEITRVADKSGNWLVVSVTKQELEKAPAFDRSALDRAADASRTTNTPAADKSAAVQTNPGMMGGTSPGVANNGIGTDQLSTGSINNPAVPATRPEVLTEVKDSKLSANDLIGASVYGSNNADIGEIGDVIMTSSGTVSGFVVDVGGFLGMGQKEVAMDIAKVKIMQDSGGRLVIKSPFSEDRLKQQKAFDEKGFKSNPDAYLLR